MAPVGHEIGKAALVLDGQVQEVLKFMAALCAHPLSRR